MSIRIMAALAVPTLALGAALAVASPATAHTPDISADCGGVHVGATAYDAGLQNHWSVTIGGVTQNGDFGASFDRTFAVPQDGTATAWSAYVEAADGTYHADRSGTVGPCGPTPPSEVQRAEDEAVEGCDVTFQGTAYGAGALTYTAAYTDSNVFDAHSNSWHLVTDTTPTVTDVHFVPWSTQAQVGHGCVEKPLKPAAVHTSHSQSQVNCSTDVDTTTTWTVTTPYVYDAATNAWVPGQPVKHKTTHDAPMKPGACTGTTAATGHAAADASVGQPAAGTPAPSSDTAIPSVIDAGLSAAPTRVSAVASPAAPAARPQAPRSVVLLLLSGLALLVGGAVRFSRI